MWSRAKPGCLQLEGVFENELDDDFSHGWVARRRIAAPTELVHGDTITIGLDTFEVVDETMLRHPESLSTIPPPTPRRWRSVPDVEGLDTVTQVARLDVLSAREREVLKRISLGHTQREIADQLHISVKTVESHRARICEKLACESRADLVSYAISGGMLGGG